MILPVARRQNAVIGTLTSGGCASTNGRRFAYQTVSASSSSSGGIS